MVANCSSFRLEIHPRSKQCDFRGCWLAASTSWSGWAGGLQGIYHHGWCLPLLSLPIGRPLCLQSRSACLANTSQSQLKRNKANSRFQNMQEDRWWEKQNLLLRFRTQPFHRGEVISKMMKSWPPSAHISVLFHEPPPRIGDSLAELHPVFSPVLGFGLK